MHSLCLNTVEERPQLFFAAEFDPFALAQLLGALVNVVEKLLPSSQQFHRLVER